MNVSVQSCRPRCIRQKLPKARSNGAPLGLLPLVILTLALGACSRGAEEVAEAAPAATDQKGQAHEEKEGLKLTEEQAKRAGIRVQAVQLQTLADTLSLTATVRVNRNRLARIAPRVEGRIVAVAANLGDEVGARQTLATLDSIAIGEAHSSLLQAQAAQRVAAADYARAKSLIAEEIIAQKDFLRARGEYERSAAELRGAQDKLRLLGASAGSKTERNASTFPVVAPFAGTVIEKNATLGDLATPSEALFTVADLSTVWVEANLPEAALSKVSVGASATVKVPAYPGDSFSGRVTYLASLLDKETRSVAARIEVENQDGRLKPEMFATAVIETGGKTREALSVPDEAIVLFQGQPTVFVAEHGGYEARPIELGDKLEGRTVIKSGLAAGEQLVSAGAYALKARLLKSQISDTH